MVIIFIMVFYGYSSQGYLSGYVLIIKIWLTLPNTLASPMTMALAKVLTCFMPFIREVWALPCPTMEFGPSQRYCKGFNKAYDIRYKVKSKISGMFLCMTLLTCYKVVMNMRWEPRYRLWFGFGKNPCLDLQ